MIMKVFSIMEMSLFVIMLLSVKCCKGGFMQQLDDDEESEMPAESRFPRFFTYKCLSKVSDHAAIDMDQKEIISELHKNTVEGFTSAGRIYELGCNSRSYANLTLLEPSMEFPDATLVMGYTPNGKTIGGQILAGEEDGDTVLWFLYDVTENLGNHVGCRVGGSPNPVIDDCLAPSGIVEVMDGYSSEPIIMNYTYYPQVDNRNGRRLIKFSLESELLLYRCVFCPYQDYQKFINYYGQFSYAHEWISSAFVGFPTDFKNGNLDFSKISRKGRAEAIKIGTVYMSLWMYIIREMEFAIDHCTFGCGGELGCSDKIYNEMVHAWDQAVAFYTGALEQSGRGYLLFSLADRMCDYFGTCWTQGVGSQANSVSYVNMEAFKYFNKGQNDLIRGECTEARYSKERVVQYMTVPLVQATIHAAYLMGVQNYTTDEIIAMGASFAASILPLVDDCDSADADIIFSNMHLNINQDPANNPGSAPSRVDFQAVKTAFERNYECMGITCEDVGGITKMGFYHPGGEPCSDAHLVTQERSMKDAAFELIVIFGLLGAIVCLACVLRQASLAKNVKKTKKDQQKEYSNSDQQTEILKKDHQQTEISEGTPKDEEGDKPEDSSLKILQGTLT